jgi:hypothetical protein
VKHARVVTAHGTPDRPPLQVAVGDVVHAGDRDTDWPEFVFVTTATGSGWVPARHLSQPSGVAVVQTAYDTTELSTEVGDLLDVLDEDTASGWSWCRASGGGEGWVPGRALDDAGD